MHLILSFWSTICNRVRPMLSDRWMSVLSVLSVLPVTFVHCGQTVGRIKMKLGTQVGLVPDHIVLDGDPAPPPPKGHSTPSQFSAHICCGQMAAWIKMTLNWYGARPRPSRLCVRWGLPSPSPIDHNRYGPKIFLGGSTS